MSDKTYQYKIGHWTLNPWTSELIHGNNKTHLQNQVAKVLVILIEANGKVISKKDLLEKAWEGAIVTENSLDKSISELRKILGDSRANPQYIETIPKKGYRLIAPLKKVELEESILPMIKKRSVFKWILLFLLLTISALAFFFNQNIRSKKILAPNGKTIASVKSDGSHYGLYTENIINGKVHKLDSFPKPESLVVNWSSDSNHIIYNTTLSKDDFYAINVLDLSTNNISYIKFSKNESKSIPYPNDLDSPPKFLEHKKLSKSDNTVHYIAYTNKDTIKVLFNDNVISDFKW
ncbi:winged helix-turn-helix domain-containing protein [Flagellimonas meishanensis]|uniref:winged helix-turn-helix domain-containing protein n=1 Tax=Flagellimonas meishanensis TaxID=2873264 RepID=UPI00223B4EC5|nr:transcriptional regulator [[Muricauda] meishanensis]